MYHLLLLLLPLAYNYRMGKMNLTIKVIHPSLSFLLSIKEAPSPQKGSACQPVSWVIFMGSIRGKNKEMRTTRGKRWEFSSFLLFIYFFIERRKGTASGCVQITDGRRKERLYVYCCSTHLFNQDINKGTWAILWCYCIV